jgi:hypothetical protein
METTTNMRKTLTMLTLAVAMLAAQPAIAPALTINDTWGHAAERKSLRGTIVQVDQNRRAFVLHWFTKPSGKPGTNPVSYQQTFRVTAQTVYKNGSWTNMVPGAVVRIRGHADVLDTVKFGD